MRTENGSHLARAEVMANNVRRPRWAHKLAVALSTANVNA